MTDFVRHDVGPLSTLPGPLTEGEWHGWARDTAEWAITWGRGGLLLAALVERGVPYSADPLASDLSPLPAGTHKPEPDTPQGVAADTAVVDAEGDPSYRDGVHTGQSEDERQAWLRRVQAER